MFRWLARFVAPREGPGDPHEWQEYAEIVEALRDGDISELERLAGTVPDFPHGKDRPLGRSWLVNAIDLGSMDAIAWVVEHFANVAFYDDDGRSPLTAAIEREWPGLGQKDDTHKVVALLIDRGVRVDTHHPTTGTTPLHVAAAHGTSETINLLLDFGADPLARDSDPFGADQPIDYVDAKKRPEIRQLLSDVMRSAGV